MISYSYQSLCNFEISLKIRKWKHLANNFSGDRVKFEENPACGFEEKNPEIAKTHRKFVQNRKGIATPPLEQFKITGSSEVSLCNFQAIGRMVKEKKVFEDFSPKNEPQKIIKIQNSLERDRWKNMVETNPMYIPTKFEENLSTGFGEDEKCNCERTMDVRRRTEWRKMTHPISSTCCRYTTAELKTVWEIFFIIFCSSTI